MNRGQRELGSRVRGLGCGLEHFDHDLTVRFLGEIDCKTWKRKPGEGFVSTELNGMCR